MEVVKVETLTDIKKNDIIWITGDSLYSEPFSVRRVKVSETDGTEVIFDMKNNRFFNVQMYLDGKSWVKKVCVLQP